MEINTYNPLPRTLRHYEAALRETLADGGVEARAIEAADGEIGVGNSGRVHTLKEHLKLARRNRTSSQSTLVLWPLLGWWEQIIWRQRAHAFIVMHDPKPLRRQIGFDPYSARIAAAVPGRQRSTLIVHTSEGADLTRQLNHRARIEVVAHPMMAPAIGDRPGQASRDLLVIGQFKSARDTVILERIAPDLRALGWNLKIVGRGWPSIPGWHVEDKFLSEAEFDRELASAAAVLLPYKFYFQSGVALRALEVGTPVVGSETKFLSGVFGEGFPGAVTDWDDPMAWARAIDEAVGSNHVQIESATLFAKSTALHWREILSQ